jgi:hypothetical protein
MLKAAERGLSAIVAKRLVAEKQMIDAITEYEASRKADLLADEITTRKKEYGKLNEDLARAQEGHNRSVLDKEFNARQDVARKELDLFTAQEELKIRMMDRRNRKLIEGEEGASATALSALNEYISQRKRGELDIETQKRSLVIANADVEQQISNYKFDIERKIAELKKKGLEMAMKEAELAGKVKEAKEAGKTIPNLDAPPTTQAKDLGLASAGGFATAKRQAQAIQDQINSARAQGLDLTNQENLDGIAKAILPRRQLEGFADQIINAQQLLKGLSTNTDDSVKVIRIQSEVMAQKLIIERELAQSLAGLRKQFDAGEISAEEHDAILAEVNNRYTGPEGVLSQLSAEMALREKHNKLLEQAVAIEGLRQSTKASALGTQKTLVQGAASMAQGLTMDTFVGRRIGAQSEIEQRRLELEQSGAFEGEKSDEALAAFETFKEQKLIDAEKLGEMDGLIERFGQLSEIASGVGNAISTAFTQGFADIMTGAASVQDVLGNMFQGIADSFMQMAQKLIAEMIKMIALKALLGVFGMEGGFGVAEGTGKANPFGALFGGGAKKMATGGIVQKPTAAIIGEGGMNEAVVPLPNGKAIPVDFGLKGKKGGMLGGGDTNTNITVNVDQSGNAESTTTGDQAGKLGKAIDGAVKRVIMEERRSGGLLHNGRR